MSKVGEVSSHFFTTVPVNNKQQNDEFAIHSLFINAEKCNFYLLKTTLKKQS